MSESNITIKPAGYWTLERCKKSASLHSNKHKWRNAERGAYNAAQTNGWLAECCVNMKTKDVKTRGYWTLERCKASASLHSSKWAWNKAESGAYNAARKNGWLPECCANMTELIKPNGYWTLERCKASAKPHPNPSTWEKAEIGAYRAAHINGWLPECCAHMNERKKPNGYWTLERCKASASLHSSKEAWKKEDKGAYRAAYTNGWLPECCAHMDKIRKPNGYWTLERCKASAKPHPNVRAWNKAESGAYQAARKNGWLPVCCANMTEREFDIIKYLKTAGRMIGRKPSEK
jgi:hypothetical protein